jgi:hypothetical protein
MADINQVISLGIGTPATIPYFIRVGLGQGAAAEVSVILVPIFLTLPERANVLDLPTRKRQVDLPVREDVLDLPKKTEVL